MGYALSLTTAQIAMIVMFVVAVSVVLSTLPIIYSPDYWGGRVASAFIKGTWYLLKAVNRTDYGGYWVTYYVKVVLTNPSDRPVPVSVLASTTTGVVDLVQGASLTGSPGVSVTEPPPSLGIKAKAVLIPPKG